jgi:alkylation response protein AidB-like acyl-CoA dehydrogenase
VSETTSKLPPSEQLLSRLASLAPLARQHASEGDRLARLPEPVVRELVNGGLFRVWIPQRFGGFELSLPDALRVYEAAASVDGSVGWAVMIGSGGGLFAAYLDPAAAEEIYGRSDAVIAGSGAPDGKAEQVPGGYRVTGHWRYASGAHYATLFTANCIVQKDGKPVLDAEGDPLVRAMSFDPAQVRILDTWNSLGMRGTGSHDFEVHDIFVPERRTFSVFTDTPREPGALYRLPFDVLTELPVTAVAVGIARHALEAFADLARTKRPAGTSAALARDPSVQQHYAKSHARCHSARARLRALADTVWRSVTQRGSLTRVELAEITSSCAVTVSDLSSAVADLAHLAGMSAVLPDSDFARTSRDLETLSAHVSISPRHLITAGAALLD